MEEKYCPDNGRPSMDPVMLIKIPVYSVPLWNKSMRQAMKEIEVNVAYRWFLGLDMMDSVPFPLHLEKTIHAVLKIRIFFLNKSFPEFSKNV